MWGRYSGHHEGCTQAPKGARVAVSVLAGTERTCAKVCLVAASLLTMDCTVPYYIEQEPGFELCDVPVPSPKPGHVLLKVLAASLCGTDLKVRKWCVTGHTHDTTSTPLCAYPAWKGRCVEWN